MQLTKTVQQENVEGQPATACGVCGLPSKSVRCGVISCDSCKKFFLRHRDKLDSFTCITGRGDCVQRNMFNATHLTFSNRDKYCVRCRLVRCYQAGMRVKGATHRPGKTSPSNNSSISRSSPTCDSYELIPMAKLPPSSNTLISLSSFQNCENLSEKTMKLTMVAVAGLSAAFQSMPWTVNPVNCPNDTAMWSYTMDNFNYLVSGAVDYFKRLQEFCPLVMPDRCRLFSQALVPLLAVEVTLPGRDSNLLFFGMPPRLHQTFMRFFPMYKLLETSLHEISAIMNAWKPSFTESALLQAMIVFRTDCLSKLTDPQIVINANQQLHVTLDSYVTRTSSSDREAELKKHYFMRVYELLLTSFQGNYEIIITHLANSRPDLIHINRLFVDMYSLPNAIDCERQYRVLSGPNLENENSP